MKIYRKTLDGILSHIPNVPPETGGIIGGEDQIVSQYIFDCGNHHSNGYDIYAPNTMLLNRVLEHWRQEGIAFYGIFHSHFPGETLLSDGDKKYITEIMLAMPAQINCLYFPLVFPRKNIISYRAGKYGSEIKIVRDEIEIL